MASLEDVAGCDLAIVGCVVRRSEFGYVWVGVLGFDTGAGLVGK